MSNFGEFFRMGVHHILSLGAYDHVLFIVALLAVFTLRDWRRILIVITGFTIGHSITLVLASLDVLKVRAEYAELLIPFTILITALTNIFRSNRTMIFRGVTAQNIYSVVFGLIHGLAFSSAISGLLRKSDNLLGPLLGFNLGVEVGQIIVAAVLLAVAFIFIDLIGTNRRDWNLVLSGAAAGVAVLMILGTQFA